MSESIVTLSPRSYVKKTQKTKFLKDSDEFIEDLLCKLEEWNLKYTIETKPGIAYKLKYSSFQRLFSTKVCVIIYVVSPSSENSFLRSMKVLLCSKPCKEETENIIIISLDGQNFIEYREYGIETVLFGNGGLSSIPNQWEILEDILREKLQNIKEQTKSLPFTPSLTLPIAIPNQKSPSKIKSFFQSFPTKLDTDKKKYSKDQLTKNETASSIGIPESDKFTNGVADISHKKDYSLRSLNSFFRKSARKSNNTGISTNSSTSTCSKKSDTLYNNISGSFEKEFDMTYEVKPSSEESIGIYSSSFEKTKKSKIKDKIDKASHIVDCHNSPHQSHKKHVKTALFDVAHFTSLLIKSSSEIQIKRLVSTATASTYSQIGQDEICNHSSESTFSPLGNNGRVKFYSWSADFTKNEEIMTSDVTHSRADPVVTALESTKYDDLHRIESENHYTQCNNTKICQRTSNNVIEDDFSLSIRSSIDHDPEDLTLATFTVNQQSQHSDTDIVSLDSSSPKTGHDDFVFLENKGDESHGSFIVDVNKSKENKGNYLFQNKVPDEIERIDERKIHRVELSQNDTELDQMDLRCKEKHSCETDAMKQLADNIDKTIFFSYKTSSNQVDRFVRRGQPSSRSIFGSESVVHPYQVYLYRTAKTYIKNPIIVGSLFTITALTAPMWRKLVPNYEDVGVLMTSIIKQILHTDVVQAIPNQLVSTVRVGVISTASTLKRFFIAVPDNDVLFNGYKLIFC